MRATGRLIDLLRADTARAAVRWNATVSAVAGPGQRQVEVSFSGSDTESYDFVAALLSAVSWRFVTPNPGVDCWCV